MSKDKKVNFILLDGAARDRLKNRDKSNNKINPYLGHYLLAGTVGAVILLFVGWPMTPWFLVSALVTFLAYTAAGEIPKGDSVKQQLSNILTKNIFNATLWITFGFGVLLLFQIVLNSVDSRSKESRVIELHSMLSEYRRGFDQALGWEIFIIVIPILAFLAIYYQRLFPLNSFIKIRDCFGKVSLVLFIVSTFTLASYAQITYNDNTYLARFQYKLDDADKEIGKLNREVVIYKWLTQQFNEMEEEDIDYFKEMFKEVRKLNKDKSRSNNIIRVFSRQSLEGVLSNEERAERAVFRGVNLSSSSAKLRYPSDARRYFRKQKQKVKNLESTKSIAKVALELILSEILPLETKGFAKVLLDTMKTSLVELVINRISSGEGLNFTKVEITTELEVKDTSLEQLKNRRLKTLKQVYPIPSSLKTDAIEQTPAERAISINKSLNKDAATMQDWGLVKVIRKGVNLTPKELAKIKHEIKLRNIRKGKR